MRRVLFALCTASLSIFAGCRAPETARSLSCFPIGIYSVPATNDLKVIREAGFNLVVGRAERAYLNAAGAVGLGVLATPETSAGPGFNPVAARRAVKDFDRHPALWGWYLTYEALARGANGLFYYAFDDGRWRLREHPETWAALQAVVREVNDRLPLFRAAPQWWAKRHGFGDHTRRFNAALESGITSSLLRVGQGNALVPAGDYIVAVNNTEHDQTYSFALPQDARGQRSEGRGSRFENRGSSTRPASGVQDPMRDTETAVPVLEENRSLVPHAGRLTDSFPPYSVHVYGPL